MTQTNTPKAVEDCHKLLLYFIPKLNQFPRAHRFTLGDRIEIKCLSLLENLVEAAFSKHKKLLIGVSELKHRRCKTVAIARVRVSVSNLRRPLKSPRN